YDTVFCNQVLEHVSSPENALREIHRILKPHGVLILAAPHLSRLHEEPHDYYRYTQHGFGFLLKKAGFSDIRTTTAGGLLSFFFHQVSTVFLSVVWGIPVVSALCFFLNKIILVKSVVWLDERAGTQRKFPVNNIAIAVK
ncbi:MAG: methyltransferase domain-containing protein, partial [Ignavibacteria bacterium]